MMFSSVTVVGDGLLPQPGPGLAPAPQPGMGIFAMMGEMDHGLGWIGALRERLGLIEVDLGASICRSFL